MLGQKIVNNILGHKPKADSKSKNQTIRFGFREENVGPERWKKRHEIVKRYLDNAEDPWFDSDDTVTVANFEIALMWLNDRGYNY